MMVLSVITDLKTLQAVPVPFDISESIRECAGEDVIVSSPVFVDTSAFDKSIGLFETISKNYPTLMHRTKGSVNICVVALGASGCDGKFSPNAWAREFHEGVQMLRTMFDKIIVVGTPLYNPDIGNKKSRRWVRRLNDCILQPDITFDEQHFSDTNVLNDQGRDRLLNGVLETLCLAPKKAVSGDAASTSGSTHGRRPTRRVVRKNTRK